MYVHASAVIQMFRMCVEGSGLSSLQSTVSATESKVLEGSVQQRPQHLISSVVWFI